MSGKSRGRGSRGRGSRGGGSKRGQSTYSGDEEKTTEVTGGQEGEVPISVSSSSRILLPTKLRSKPISESSHETPLTTGTPLVSVEEVPVQPSTVDTKTKNEEHRKNLEAGCRAFELGRAHYLTDHIDVACMDLKASLDLLSEVGGKDEQVASYVIPEVSLFYAKALSKQTEIPRVVEAEVNPQESLVEFETLIIIEEEEKGKKRSTKKSAKEDGEANATGERKSTRGRKKKTSYVTST